MITLTNVSYRYPGTSRPVVDGLSLSVDAPGVYGLLGANGEGKSTLLYLMAGLLRPSTGDAQFDGISTWLRRVGTLSQIFLVPEEFDLPAMPLQQYADLTAPLYPRFDPQDFNTYLTEFRIPAAMHLGSMSMGQRKKSLIAFALACNTPLLLMDEPTNGLDIPGKAAFRRAVARAGQQQRTIVISTHQVRDLDQVLTGILMLMRHQVVLNAPMTDIARRLRFATVTDPAQTAGALYSEAVPGGYNVITHGPGSVADINLETLFDFAYNYPTYFTSES